MTLAAGLKTYLASVSALTDLVGDRIYPATAPELEMGAEMQPTIVFWQVDRRREADLALQAVIDRSQWGLWCLAASYDDAKELEDVLLANLAFFQGDLGGVTVQSVLLVGAEDTDDQLQFGVFGVACGFEIVRAIV